MLAKALWEGTLAEMQVCRICFFLPARASVLGILVELPLAPFFLSLLLGRTNTVHDMPAFDAQLARSLRLLRDYDGDVEDLCLSFAVDQYTAEHCVNVAILSMGLARSLNWKPEEVE